jgi:cyclic-di-GMP-binding protein
MPSFDIVSEIDAHELANAVDQMNREISNRYDVKGADAKVEHKENALNIEAASEFQVQQMEDIIYTKLAKRNIDTRCLDKGKIEERGKRAYQTITVKQGIDKELGKKLTKLVKDSKLKVQAAIQGEQLRVTGKNRDDLQAAMALFRQSDIELPLQFTNFRD